jgi:membrane associated rhomboid family serine protease
MESILTFIIIIITVLTSLKAFNDPALRSNMMFNPYVIKTNKQYLRFITSGLIHADYMHLLFNMYMLYIFGKMLEPTFVSIFGPTLGGLFFVLLYGLGLIASHTLSYIKHHNYPGYNSLGASGAVSAVMFSFIFIYPISGQIWGLPSVVIGVLYLMYSQFMAEKNMDNIGHDAHFAGAIFGILFTIAIRPAFALEFIQKIITWS